MADPRTFVLIGEFKDGITPELAKINNQLAQLKQTFSNIGGKGARTASRDIGKFNAAVEGLNTTLQTQNKALRGAIEPMRQYRREVGKTVGALKKLDEAGGRSLAIERTNKALQEQIRLMDQLRSRRGMQPARMPREMDMGGGRVPRPPRGGGGGGRGGGGERNFGFEGHMAEFGFAYTLGNAISQPIQNAVVTGFQIGIGMMTKPFEYFAQNFGERVQDELSDLKAAGGLYSISKRSQNPFLRDIDDAIQYQQDTNRVFAKMAGALPGVTNDYVQVGKRLSDTAARIVGTDFEAARKEANRIRATQEGAKFYGAAPIMGTGAQAQKDTITTLLGELTKKTTLAGMGGPSRAGGIAGAYGLPGLAERMISQDEVSVGQFQRYAAVFSDPTIADALARNVENLNATQKNSVERFKALQKLLDEVVTPELIEKLRTSVDGIYQGLRSTILDPDTGLFGLGRQFQKFGKRLNQYGQYVNEANEVVTDISMAADEDLSLFEIIRDIFSNLGQVLLPIAEVLPLIFDPLKAVAKTLMDARFYAAEFNRTFNQYREGLKILSEQKGNEFLKDTLDVRAALSAINNLLAEFGVISDLEFQDIASQLTSKNLNIGKVLTEMLDKLLNSDIALRIGEMLGEIVGTVLVQVAQVTGFISGRIESSNKLVAGFQKGFKDSGGEEAFANIFQDVFKSLFNVFKAIFDVIPWQAKMIGAIMIVAPAVIQGLAMLLAESIGKGILAMGKKCSGMIPGAMGKACPTTPGGRQITGEAMSGRRRSGAYGEYQGRPQRYGPGGSIERLNRRRRASMARAGATARANAAYAAEPFVNMAKTSRAGQAMKGLGKGVAGMGRGIGKLIPGGAALAGAVDLGLALATGEDFGKAAAGAIGTVIGGAAGTIFGPAGTVIGGIIGGMVGDAAHNFVTVTMDQNKAAAMQLEAAQKQVAAAATAASKKYGPEFGDKLGGVEALNQAMGGGAGVKAYAEEQLRLGKITAEQAQNWEILGGQLTDVNKTTAKVEKAQKLYDTAVRLNTGQQEKYKKMLEAAEREQQAALSKITVGWEQMSATNRTKLLQGADNIVAALDGAAAKIRNWKGIPTITPDTKPTTPAAPPKTTQTQQEQRSAPGQKPLDSRKLLPGLPATPESGYGAAAGRLGDAIASEMRMKPPGSDLVIANSSETVIPAAGGNQGGMVGFVAAFRDGLNLVANVIRQTSQQTDTKLSAGFQTLVTGYKLAQERQVSAINRINATLINNQQQTNARLAKLETKFTTPMMPGGLGGAGAGGVDAFTPIAQRYGLQMTSGYRPGDPGWHGANRARDFSNGTGPTPQMMQFAQYMATTYGQNLKELIYTPLGFSIKNGQKVPPYAQGSHYNHVHVAYALGYNNGRMFTTLDAAQSWENSMVPGSVKVASITGNSAEGFGGETSVVNNITINQQPGQDADELASIVALKIGEAVADARAASVFV